MSQRSSSVNTGLGWMDVVAIVVVIAILAFALGEIAAGRVRELTIRARTRPAAPHVTDATVPPKEQPS